MLVSRTARADSRGNGSEMFTDSGISCPGPALVLVSGIKKSRRAHAQQQQVQYSISLELKPYRVWQRVHQHHGRASRTRLYLSTSLHSMSDRQDPGQTGCGFVWTKRNKPVIAQMGVLQCGIANVYTVLPVEESDSAQMCP